MNTVAFIPGMSGGPELLIVLFIILLLFGSKKLPELSRSLGKSLGEFKKGKEDLEREINLAKDRVYDEVTTSVKEENDSSDEVSDAADFDSETEPPVV